jgi:hypothetical protein
MSVLPGYVYHVYVCMCMCMYVWYIVVILRYVPIDSSESLQRDGPRTLWFPSPIKGGCTEPRGPSILSYILTSKRMISISHIFTNPLHSSNINMFKLRYICKLGIVNEEWMCQLNIEITTLFTLHTMNNTNFHLAHMIYDKKVIVL